MSLIVLILVWCCVHSVSAQEVRRDSGQFFDSSEKSLTEELCSDVLTCAPSSDNQDFKTSNACWTLKTNGLYDLALVPNVGLEYYIGKNWSVAGNWMYAWWSSESKHNYWRIYGGDLEVRRWLGKKSKENPLHGHHVGVYGQLVTYDFEFGGEGYQADKWTYGFGLSYGYSFPIARALNLDLTLGVGYLSGNYKEYLPIEGHYVWQATKKLNYWGPTKAEVSLVWLLGSGFAERKKGGRR